MNEFLSKHPIFTLSELKSYLASRGTTGSRAAESMLLYYRRRGKICGIKRGVYATVPPGMHAGSFMPDPYLIASRLTPDALLIHHTALELHGKNHTLFHQYTFQTRLRAGQVEFRGMRFLPVQAPKSLITAGNADFGSVNFDRRGLAVRASSLERTMVDILANPRFCGSWEEVWRSLDSIEFFDTNTIVTYVRLLGNATTAAKVGFYLHQNRKRLMVDSASLEALRKMRPKNTCYFDASAKGGGHLDKGWNLIINKQILDRGWEESHEIVD
jgi:predicted transcriptional regulator of viral defense system